MVLEASEDRRLTTIMAIDVVGYSRLMSEDEAGTLAALKEDPRQCSRAAGQTVRRTAFSSSSAMARSSNFQVS